MQKRRDLAKKLTACLIVFMLMFTNCSTLCSALVAYAADDAREKINFSAQFVVIENTDEDNADEPEIETEEPVAEEGEDEPVDVQEEPEDELEEVPESESENELESESEPEPESESEVEPEPEVVEQPKEEQVLEDGLAIEITIGIKDSGYLKNSKIEIKDLANQIFKLKDDISYGEYIQSIEENKIKIKQIDSGTEIKVYIPIELKSEEWVNVSKLQQGTEIQLTTAFVNNEGEEEILTKSTQPVINIKNDMKLVVEGEIEKFIPYVKDGVNEALVQMKVKVGTNTNNELPIKDTTVQVSIPQIDGAEIKDFTVSAISTGFTNGLLNGETQFTVENWNYQDNVVNISVNNSEKDGMYKMNNGNDEYIISYKYSNISDISNEILHSTVNVLSNVFTSENTNQISGTIEKEYDLSQANSNIITYDLTRKTEELSKGYLYANANTDQPEYQVEYDNILDVNISRVDLVKIIEIRELSENFIDLNGETYDASSSTYYKSVKVNKANLLKIIGETGNLELLTEDGISLITVNKDIQDDGDGNITISFGDNRIAKVVVRINNPVSDGILNITAMKVMEKINFDKMKMMEFTGIKSEYVAAAQLTDEIITEMGTKSVYTELQNTMTDATLSLNRMNLSTLVKNEDVEIELALNNAISTSDMYANPVFEIVFPEQITNLDVKDINLLYGNDELEISNIETFVNDNGSIVLRLSLEGRQTKYVAAESDKGTTVIMNTDIDVDMYTASKDTSIIMNYYNEDATNYGWSVEWNLIAEPSPYMMLIDSGIYDADVKIVAPDGLVNAQVISNYKDDAVLMSVNQGRKEDTIPTFTDARKAEMKLLVINNTSKDMTDVKILGRTIFTNNKSIIDNQVLGTNMTAPMISTISVENTNEGTTIYYSEKEEATDDLSLEENEWTTDPSNLSLVRSYLIVLDGTLRDGTILTYSYKFEIPENLSNNLDLAGTFATYYTEDEGRKVVEADKVMLTTGDAPVLKVETVSDADGLNAVEGQRIKYTVRVTNEGRTTSENTIVKCVVPDGTTYVNENGELDASIREFDVELGDILAGRTVEAKYEVEVNETKESIDNEKHEVQPENEVKADGLEIPISTTTNDKLFVQRAEAVIRLDAERPKLIIQKDVEAKYTLIVTNKKGATLKNAVITYHLPEGLEFVEAYLQDFSNDGRMAEKGQSGIYDKDSRTIVWNMNSFKNYKAFTIVVKGGEVSDIENVVTSYVTLKADNLTTTYTSNEVKTVVAKPQIDVNYYSTESNRFITEGDIIEYVLELKNTGKADALDINVSNVLPKELHVISAELERTNGSNLTAYAGQTINLSFPLKIGESAKLYLKCSANSVNGIEEKFATNNWKITGANVNTVTTREIQNIVQPSEATVRQYEVAQANVNPIENATSVPQKETKKRVYINAKEETKVSVQTYKITGIAFNDFNKNGKRDAQEKGMQNVVAKLCDANTQKVLSMTVTNAAGEYLFENVVPGEYYVKFEYDTARYEVTDYQKSGVNNDVNSDAIVSNYKTVTDKIEIVNTSISNIDLGLCAAGIFDLSLDVNINKVTVQNEEETKTFDMENSKLAKVDIDPKSANSTKVFIEYTISVTNTGEISGYAKSIVDYMPSELELDTTVNQNWYIAADGNAYTRELENILIQPGETKNIRLVLTKQMTDESTGLINNNFEIVASYNERAIADIDSVEGNKANGEDDMSNADMIIGIKTGGGIISIMIISTTLITLLIALYVIKLHIDKKNKEVIV